MTSKIDQRGFERLYKALEEDKSNINSFERLAWGQHRTINDDDLASLMHRLISKEGGAKVAVKILSTRLHRQKGEKPITSQKIIEVSREVLLQFSYEEKSNADSNADYELTQLANFALKGKEAIQSTIKLCQHLADGFKMYTIYSFSYPRLLSKLAQIQPHIFLDSFIGQDEYMFRRMVFDDLERADSPVNQIPENILIEWCEQKPEIRYPQIVSSMQMYTKPKGSDELSWHPILSIIFENSPNMKAVLSQLENEIYPMSWSGSRADAMARRLSLLGKLFEHPNLEIQAWAVEQYHKLQIAVEKERTLELKENQERFERFE
jgi:hypothetical protein